MVHKVTMDTVKIITSSLSGMTNVSESTPCPAGHHSRANEWLLLHLGGWEMN